MSTHYDKKSHFFFFIFFGYILLLVSHYLGDATKCNIGNRLPGNPLLNYTTIYYCEGNSIAVSEYW